ncbi:hypothetical protein N0V86_008029 [Didymella sp. IMI 355093]|nr:hypothetical protein N0V86_008029 [Didymella sp. IMI 355093]
MGNKDRSKENTKKSDKNVRIVRAKDIKDRLYMDREGFVLFAMLAGGDYNTVGLRGCGTATALSAAREGTLAHSLCLCRNQKDCVEWSYRLAAFFQAKPPTRSLQIPANFPDYKILQKYYKPKVTSDENLLGKQRLDLTVPRPIQEHKLLQVTSERFNIWGRLYMNWVGPVLLSRSLLLNGSSQPETTDVVHNIKLTKQRASTSEEVMTLRCFERKITFSPFGLTTLRRDDLEGGGREGMWDGKVGMPFDPTYRVECDYFPAFVLRQALLADVPDPPPPASKQKASKRKQHPELDTIDAGPISPAKKKQKPRKSENEAARTQSSPGCELLPAPIDRPTTNSKRKDAAVNAKPSTSYVDQAVTIGPREFIDLTEADNELVLRLPPVRKSQQSLSVRESPGGIVGPGSPESSEGEDEDLVRAIYLSMQPPDVDRNMQDIAAPSTAPSVPRTQQTVQRLPRAATNLASTTSTTVDGIDNETTNASKILDNKPNELVKIRSARLKHFASSSLAIPRQVTPTRTPQRSIESFAECIDLTGD